MNIPNSLHLHLEKSLAKQMANISEKDSRTLRNLNLNLNIYENTTTKTKK